MKRIISIIITSLFMGLIPSTAHAASFKVIVHESNPIDSISRSDLADYFLKQKTRWQSGRAITPVDQSEKSKTRDEFSRNVMGKEVPWVKSYWQRMIFSGRATPPAELSADAEVLNLVSSDPDAIGYVSSVASTAPGVKVIELRD
jgi:ABC-type phosphate transport system substrate-binding protein